MESLNAGPGGIIPADFWIAKIHPPKGGLIRIEFVFNAAWENMLWVCSGATGEILAVKGNYFRPSDPWISPVDPEGNNRYAIVGYHKTTSPEDSNAGSFPWIQSPMKFHGRSDLPLRDIFGFSDHPEIPPLPDNPFNNAFATVVYIGGEGAPEGG